MFLTQVNLLVELATLQQWTALFFLVYHSLCSLTHYFADPHMRITYTTCMSVLVRKMKWYLDLDFGVVESSCVFFRSAVIKISHGFPFTTTAVNCLLYIFSVKTILKKVVSALLRWFMCAQSNPALLHKMPKWWFWVPVSVWIKLSICFFAL